MVDKIYCCDRGSNDILAAAMLGKKDTDPMALMAAMNGGANNWMNNPWMYLIFLALFGGNGLGFGNRGLQGTEIQSQIDSLRNQMADNHNSDLLMSAIKGNDNAISALAASLNCDFNQLQGGICAVRSAIEQVGGQVGFSAERVINAVNMGDCNVIQAIKDCCCNTQQNILRMGYENQLGQKDIEYKIQTGLDFVNRSVERGFSGIGFQMQQDKCDIVRAGQDNTIPLTVTGRLTSSRGTMTHVSSSRSRSRMLNSLRLSSLRQQRPKRLKFHRVEDGKVLRS